jgi:hypothetical protein
MQPTDTAATPPLRTDLINRWIAEALRMVGLSFSVSSPPVGPVPVTRILEAFGILFQPVPDLTRQRAREFLRLPRNPGGDEPVPDRDHSPLAGLMAHRGSNSVVLVNAHDIVTRRRFTMAHELGHHLLHRPRDQNGILRYDLPAEEGGNITKKELDYIENEAHLFAASLLMPAPWVRAWFSAQDRGKSISPGLACSRLATLLLVSRIAAAKRATALRHRKVNPARGSIHLCAYQFLLSVGPLLTALRGLSAGGLDHARIDRRSLPAELAASLSLTIPSSQAPRCEVT